jgi:hypothetical protein
MPATFPRLALEIFGVTDSMFTTAQRYDFGNVNFNPGAAGWAEVLTYVYRLRIIYADLRIALNNPFEAEVRKAFRLAGPKLGIATAPRTPGLPYVQRWGPLSGTRQIGADPNTGGVVRLQSVFDIPVTLLFDGQSLTT